MSARTCRASLLALTACGRVHFDPLVASDAAVDVVDASPRPPIQFVGAFVQPDHPATATEILTLPPGVMAGDYMVLVFYANQLNANAAVPLGWMTRLQYNEPAHQYQATFAWRVAGTNEPASYNVAVTNSSDVAWILAVYRGVSAVDIDAAGEQDASIAPSEITYTGASLVTTQPGDELLLLVINDSNAGAATWTAPGDMAARTPTSNIRTITFDRALDAAGATGDEIATLSEIGATGPSGAVWMLALAR